MSFSDAVFAISVTLLVLGISPPDDFSHLLSALVKLWPSYLGYTMSFLLIAQVWVNGCMVCASGACPFRPLGAGMGSRMELFAAIRFDWRRHRLSIRALADKYGVHRLTVRQAIESVLPPDRRGPTRQTPVLNQVRELVDAMLVADLNAPRKQRHTAKRIFERLVAEHDARVGAVA